MKVLRSLRFWQLSAIALALLLVGGVIGAAMAGVTAETRSGGAIKAVKVLRGTGNNIWDLGATSPVTITTTTMTVPAGQKAILLITLSGESQCYDSTGGGWCGIDILVNGTPARPDGSFAFDSDNGGTEVDGSYEAHSIQRSTNVLNSGTYTIEVQAYDGAGAPWFWLGDWHLTVERIFKAA